ncbi:MAG: PQQ-binding-like beta-propeller repeat protein, partial [Candidatus Micrarchaeota archaeon]
MAGMKWASPVRFSSPVVGALLPTASFAYLLTQDGTVYNVDIAAGSASSIFRLNSPAHVPPVLIPLSQVAVFGGEDGRLTALRNGVKAWGYVPDDACAPDARTCHLNTTLQGLAASGQMVYASYSDRLVAIDSSGIVQWENKLPSNASGPVATDGARVYVMDGNDLVAYKADRSFAWRVALGPYFKTSPSPDPSGAYVFAASTDGYVAA